MKSLLDQISGNFFKQCTADSAPAVFGIDPDAFEKWDGLCSAAVSVFPYAYLGKTKGRMVWTQCKIARPFLAFEHSGYVAKMFIDRRLSQSLKRISAQSALSLARIFRIRTDMLLPFFRAIACDNTCDSSLRVEQFELYERPRIPRYFLTALTIRSVGFAGSSSAAKKPSLLGRKARPCTLSSCGMDR